MESKIFLNTFYQILGKFIISIFGFLTTYLLAHKLGAVGFSEYSLVFSFVGFAFIFADFGLGTLLTRTIASKKIEKKYISDIFTLRILISLLILMISVIIVFFLPYTLKIKTGIIIASFSSIFLLLSSTIWSVFQAELNFRKIVLSQIISSLSLFVFILAVIYFNLSFYFFISATVISAFVGLLISFKLSAIKSLISFDASKYKTIVRKSLPFGLGLIASVAYFKIDSIILSFYYNPSFKPDVGFYALSYKIFEVGLVFGGFFSQSLFPYFSKIINTQNLLASFKKYFIYSLLLSIATTLFLFFFAKPLVLILGGPDFVKSVFPLQILSFAAGVSILSGFFLSVAIAGHKEIMLLKLSAAAFFINVILNLIFIPQFSLIAASYITVITQFFILGANAYAAILCLKRQKLIK
ncbi:MAG: flippase [Candidatus Levybacteria bacterium]|nr:flippase [Candidatus Levybacteria bacterium]